MTNPPMPLTNLRRVAVPALLSSATVLALPATVQERFATRIDAVVAGLERRAAAVRGVHLTLAPDTTPLITATLAAFDGQLEIRVLADDQPPGHATLALAIHRHFEGRPLVYTEHVAHQLFEHRLQAFLL